MILTLLPLDPRALGLGGSSSGRAEGLHASTICNSFYADLNPKKYAYDGPPSPFIVEMGLIYEQMLEEGLRRHLAESDTTGEIVRPGEFTHTDDWVDGEGVSHSVVVHYNPDLFIFNGVGLRVAEIKSRWAGSKLTHQELAEAQEDLVSGREESDVVVKVRDSFLDPAYDKYWSQLKFYCYMLKCRYGRFYVWWVNANYKPPFPSQMGSIDVEFSQDELDQEYRVMMMHAASKGLI